MPGLKRLAVVVVLCAVASILYAQTPTQRVRIDTVRDTVYDTVRDTVHDTVAVADTADRYYQLAERAIEFKKSTLDSLMTFFSIGIGVAGLILAILIAAGTWLLQRSREMSAAESKREQEFLRNEVLRTRQEVDRILSSAESDAGSIRRTLEEINQIASSASSSGGADAEVRERVKKKSKGAPKDKIAITSWAEKINKISESDAKKSIDLYEQLRFEMNVKGVDDGSLPSSLRLKMAENYYRIGRLNRASEELEAYTRQIPDDADALNDWGGVLGDVYYSTKDVDWLEQSLEKYEQAAKLRPDDAEIVYNLAVVIGAMYEATNNVEWLKQALTKCEEATTLMPKFPEAFYNWGVALGWMYESTKDTTWLEQALEKYERANALDPDDDEILDTWSGDLIRMYVATQNQEFLNQALEKSRTALNDAPDRKDYNYHIACALALMKKKEEMLAALREAVEYDVEHKKLAREDEDFKAYWDDPDFKALVGEEEGDEKSEA